jgi:hypothetical protein
MRLRGHVQLLVLAIFVWSIFWLLGWPAYYQQYSFTFQAVGSALLVPPIAWAGYATIVRAKPERRLTLSLWLSLYATLPFAICDYLYCGLYLGHGTDFPARYWYLTIFYVIPWFLYVPVGVWKRASSSASPSS